MRERLYQMRYDADLPGILESISFRFSEPVPDQALAEIRKGWTLQVTVNGAPHTLAHFMSAAHPDAQTFIFYMPSTVPKIPPFADVAATIINNSDGAALTDAFPNGITIDASMEIAGSISVAELERIAGRRPDYGPN